MGSSEASSATRRRRPSRRPSTSRSSGSTPTRKLRLRRSRSTKRPSKASYSLLCQSCTKARHPHQAAKRPRREKTTTSYKDSTHLGIGNHCHSAAKSTRGTGSCRSAEPVGLKTMILVLYDVVYNHIVIASSVHHTVSCSS